MPIRRSVLTISLRGVPIGTTRAYWPRRVNVLIGKLEFFPNCESFEAELLKARNGLEDSVEVLDDRGVVVPTTRLEILRALDHTLTVAIWLLDDGANRVAKHPHVPPDEP